MRSRAWCGARTSGTRRVARGATPTMTACPTGTTATTIAASRPAAAGAMPTTTACPTATTARRTIRTGAERRSGRALLLGPQHAARGPVARLDVEEQHVDGFGLAAQGVDAGLRQGGDELPFLLGGAAFEQVDTDRWHGVAPCEWARMLGPVHPIFARCVASQKGPVLGAPVQPHSRAASWRNDAMGLFGRNPEGTG